MPMLEKRRIEAAILKKVYDVLVARLGVSAAQDILGAAVIQDAVAQGKEFANRQSGHTSLRDFSDVMTLWEMGDALKIDRLTSTDTALEFNVTRCAYAEMYRDMGMGDIGHLMSCNRDQSFCKGFNPDMDLTVTQTIMKGATHCDFRYRLRGKNKQ